MLDELEKERLIVDAKKEEEESEWNRHIQQQKQLGIKLMWGLRGEEGENG